MKRLTILLFLSIMAFGASAQELHGGIKNGVNIAYVKNVDLGGGKMNAKAAYFVGAFAEYMFNRKWAVQPELVYSRQGTYRRESDTRTWFRANYLNLPVMAKFYAVPYTLSFELGPQVGYALRFSEVTKTGRSKTNARLDRDGDVRLNSFDFSIGAGATYYFGSIFGINARYNYGFTDVFKDSDKKTTNQVVQLGMLIRF